MHALSVLPDRPLTARGIVSAEFLRIGIATFAEACRFAADLPYAYNSDRDDLLILFKERMGTCTTKHAVIATLARELDLPVCKQVGIYAMTEALVTGTQAILVRYGLPYLPMVHCFLAYGDFRVDLTEGNANGKNGPIDTFLYVREVVADISAKAEYRLYRDAVKKLLEQREELRGIALKRILQAREEGLVCLKANLPRSLKGR